MRFPDFVDLFTRSLFRECILAAARHIDAHASRILSKALRKAPPGELPQELKRPNPNLRSPAFGSKKERFSYPHDYGKEEKKADTTKETKFSMELKMSSYERTVLMDGLFKGSRFNKLGREVLAALVAFHDPSSDESSVPSIVRLIG